MRILILSDLHGQHSTLYKLEEAIAAADLVLVAGDFTEFGGKADMESMLEPFGPALERMAAVAGNCDRMGARAALESSGVSVDGNFRRFEGDGCSLTVIGAGGGIYRNGLTPYERRDIELHSAFEGAVRKLDESGKGRGLLVVTSHTPPWDTEADSRNGSHVGSPSFRHLLDALAPALWACGHIHESRSVSRVGQTVLVNPGPLREGFYAEARLECVKGQARVDAELRSL